MKLPFSPSCERNKEPILKVLQQVIAPEDRVLLEVGSGTGQHACYFSDAFPQLEWVCSDQKENHQSIEQWMQSEGGENISGPLKYKIGDDLFPVHNKNFDVVYTANTLHIMSVECVHRFILDLGHGLCSGSKVVIYGPFNYDGKYTSQSNQDFDGWLKQRDSGSGIRNFEEIKMLFSEQAFVLKEDIEMPANNRILLFIKN
jgi:hypothetical protein